jgi:integrase
MHKPLNDITIKALPPGTNYFCWDSSLPGFAVRVGKTRKTFIVKKSNRFITVGHYGVISLGDARMRAKALLYAKYAPRTALKAPDAAQAYLGAIAGQLRPTTVSTYTLYLKRLPDVPIESLNAQLLYAALPKGKSAANLCFKVFKAFLSWCAQREYIQANPLLSRRQPNKLKSRDRLLSDAEVRAIWHATHSHNSFGALMRLLLLTGQRLGQFLDLQHSRQTAETIVFDPSCMKNNTEHVIPLTDAVRAELATYTPPKDLNAGRRAMHAALDIPRWTPHDARRYFSSTMAQLGTPIEVTERILAHVSGGSMNDIARVYNRYDYLQPMRLAFEKYHAYLASIGCST